MGVQDGSERALTPPEPSSDPRLYETHYETLRAHMIGTTAVIAHRGIGLATLLQAGVPGWLRAVGTCVRVAHGEATTAGRDRASDQGHAPMPMPYGLPSSVMPPTQSTEAARLIASLVLSAHAMHGPVRGRQGVSP